jgi:hypothetical protein
MSVLESRELQRLRYKQGQTLRSQDFRDQLRIERQLRAWHNRGVHNAYGVVRGILDDFSIESTATDLIVHKGLAYDCFGRELLLCSQTLIRLPAQQEPMLLVLQALERNCGCQSSTDVNSNCSEIAHARIATDAKLSWVPENSFSFRQGVPIARAKLSGGTLVVDTDFASPSARPLARPRIGTGTTIPGATVWEIWRVTTAATGVFATIQVTVDTSSAGFASVPQYFASLQGPVSQIDANTINVLAFHFDHIDLMRTDSFVFRFLILVLQVRPKFALKTLITKYLQDQKVYVSWLGIEENPKNREVNCEH